MDWQKLCNEIPFGLLNYSPGVTVEIAEKATILHHLKHFQGNKTQAAIACGIGISTLERKLDKYQEEIMERELKLKQVREREEEAQRRLRGLPSNADVTQSYTFVQGQGLKYQAAEPIKPVPAPIAEIKNEVDISSLPLKKRGRSKKTSNMNEAARKAMEE